MSGSSSTTSTVLLVSKRRLLRGISAAAPTPASWIVAEPLKSRDVPDVRSGGLADVVAHPVQPSGTSFRYRFAIGRLRRRPAALSVLVGLRPTPRARFASV